MNYFLQNQGNSFNKSPKFIFFSYILGFLAPGIKTSFLKSFNFFSTCLGGKIAKYGGKKFSTCKGGKKKNPEPFTISVSRFTVLEKKKQL